MQSLWTVLGVALVMLVLTALIGFFVWRPRAQRRVEAASRALAEEIHGQPLLVGPAQCKKAAVRDPRQVQGLGVVALTDQAVIFSAGTGQRTVILPRAGLRVAFKSQGPTGQMDLTSEGPPQQRVVLAVADVAAWKAALHSD